MSIARKLASLERAVHDASGDRCPHCYHGLVRIDRGDQETAGRHGYEPVVIREWMAADAGGRFRDPLSDADKARVMGWHDDDAWDAEGLSCRWCGGKVSWVCLVAPRSTPDIVCNNNYTMSKSTKHSTMTHLLREALQQAPSMLGVQKATGVKRQAMTKFRDGEQSLRLDLADKLAAYFGIQCKQTEPAVKDKIERT
jgi:hypothetical protein